MKRARNGEMSVNPSGARSSLGDVVVHIGRVPVQGQPASNRQGFKRVSESAIETSGYRSRSPGLSLALAEELRRLLPRAGLTGLRPGTPTGSHTQKGLTLGS